MSIGANLRRLRMARRMTLRELAERGGVSPALLSQVERGKANPSVNTLKRLADSLGVAIGYFFGDTRKSAFVTPPQTRNVLRVGSGITYYLLSQKTAPSLEVILNVFEVGATTGEAAHSHPGDEWGMVLSGALKVELAGSVFILEAGDSISYSSALPHRLINIGTTAAEALWVNTPARF